LLGGVAEFSREELTILAESASLAEDFDIAGLRTQIEELEVGLAKTPAGDELDRAIATLDHYKSILTSLTVTSAF
ncbi:MAG TPA: hypothetical protein VNR65_14180, partial [Geobacterales bacterium]|nr:hypothetical protein [Geobacterales bacterium]